MVPLRVWFESLRKITNKYEKQWSGNEEVAERFQIIFDSYICITVLEIKNLVINLFKASVYSLLLSQIVWH